MIEFSGRCVKTDCAIAKSNSRPSGPNSKSSLASSSAALPLEPGARHLDRPCDLEHVGALVDARVLPGVEVGDEVDAGAQRAAADVEQVVVRLEPVLDEVVELELAEVVPVLEVLPDRAPVPVGREVVAIARRDAPPRPPA